MINYAEKLFSNNNKLINDENRDDFFQDNNFLT